MMTPDDPWHGLRGGSIDARRVSGDGKCDFFWIMSPTGLPGLLLRLPEDPERPAALPELRNLDIAIRDIDGRPALIIVLTDGEQRELFSELCRDIIRAGEGASDATGAVALSIRRLMRWHHLLRGGQTGSLSLEEQRGLVGELCFLDRLATLLGPRAAIESWRGPAGGAKDFEVGSIVVEVKSRRSAARPIVQISSEYQLAEVAGQRLFLTVMTVDVEPGPDGVPLRDMVRKAEERFVAAGTEAALLWEQAINASGYDEGDSYAERQWKTGQAIDHAVVGDFPRIVAPLSHGLSSVRYALSLDACAPFVVEGEGLDGVILAEMAA